jgi:hypothetical protein
MFTLNKTVEIINTNATYGRKKEKIFEIWNLKNGAWLFSGKITAKNYSEAFDEWLGNIPLNERLEILRHGRINYKK